MGKETGFPSATKGLTSDLGSNFTSLPLSLSPPPPEERRMEISHSSHGHPLTLCETEDAGEPCNGCSRRIFDRGDACFDCGFLLHKKCAKLPREVHHHLHPKHPLTLHFNSSETTPCSVCNKTGTGFDFKCQVCEYYMGVTCFRHNHPLTLCCLTQQSKRMCKACDQQISVPAYCCKECDLLALHKSCAQLPPEIEKHPFHPSHSLTLFPGSPYHGSRTICDACGKIVQGSVYHCSKCQFDLHLHCARLKPSLKHEKHDHLLAFFDEISYQVSCNSCGKPCRNNLYRCVSCKFNVHSTCIPSAKHKHHPHPLTLKDSTPKDDSSRIHCTAFFAMNRTSLT